MLRLAGVDLHLVEELDRGLDRAVFVARARGDEEEGERLARASSKSKAGAV